nr:hypothetical protein [Hyphomonas sp. Mor2]
MSFRRLAAMGVALVLMAVFAVPILHAPVEAKPISIAIDPSEQFQTMNGWEVTLALSDQPHAPRWASFHDQVLDRAINEVGINRVRLEVRSGAETHSDWNNRFFNGDLSYQDWKPYRYPVQNDNDDPNVINWDGFSFEELDWTVEEHLLPMMAKSEARGEKLWINICYVAFINSREAHYDPDEYAEFVLATYLYLQEKYGIVPDSWEVILEPDLKNDMWTGKMIGQAIVATAPRLQEAGFEPAFIVPSVTDMRNATPYMNQIAKVPGAMDHVIEFSYHRYKGANERNLRNIAKLADKHDIGASMLEYWFGRGNAELLYQDLAIGNNVAWQGRAVTGLFDSETRGGGEVTLTPRPDTRTNRQYFYDVRLGAVRIAANSDNRRVAKPLAFQNTDGSLAIVIKTDRAAQLRLQALPPGSYRVYSIVDGQTEELPAPLTTDETGGLDVEIPGAGLITISSRAP